MEIREPILDLVVAVYELTPEEIAAGVFTLPSLDSGDVYMAHMQEYDEKGAFPEELEMHVTLQAQGENGPETLEYSVKDSPEQGWGMSYWPDSEEKTEWSWPGYFRLSTYESLIPVSFVYDQPEKVQTRPDGIVMSVSLSIDGRAILPEECEILDESMEDPLAEYFSPGEPAATFYYSRLLLKRPDWAPEHGTIRMQVTQQLFADGSVWTSEENLAY